MDIPQAVSFADNNVDMSLDDLHLFTSSQHYAVIHQGGGAGKRPLAAEEKAMI